MGDDDVSGAADSDRKAVTVGEQSLGAPLLLGQAAVAGIRWLAIACMKAQGWHLIEQPPTLLVD
jgi:hypothetical protein